jgi:hypothetical protein
MASTRNSNTAGDYKLQQNSNTLAKNYSSYLNSQYGSAFVPAMPCAGVMPSHMPRDTLSKNSIEIESSLFGINSTNLVNPQPPVKEKLKTIPYVSYFDRLPVFMPAPLVVDKKQRPFPIG